MRQQKGIDEVQTHHPRFRQYEAHLAKWSETQIHPGSASGLMAACFRP